MEPVDLNERNKQRMDFITRMKTHPRTGRLLVGKRQMQARATGKLPLVDQLQPGENQVHRAVPFTLEHIVISGGKLKRHRSAQRRAGCGIKNERILETGSKVGETGFITPKRFGVRIDINITILRGHDGETLVQRDFKLQRIHLHITTHRHLASRRVHLIRQVVIHENRMDVGRRQREVEQGRVADRAARLRESIAARRWRRLRGVINDSAGLGSNGKKSAGAECDDREFVFHRMVGGVRPLLEG